MISKFEKRPPRILSILEEKDSELPSTNTFKADLKVTDVTIDKESPYTREKIDTFKYHLDLVGQNDSLEQVYQKLRAAHVGLNTNPEGVRGGYLCAGPSGVGKTEFAKQYAKHFGLPILIINCSELIMENALTRLIGPPPGYQGSEEGGVLTNFVRDNPHGVVVFDEIEKGNSNILNLFLQMLDMGKLASGTGEEVVLKDATVFITTNLGSSVILDVDLDEAQKEEAIKDAILKGISKPEILARMTAVLNFKSIDKKTAVHIAEKVLKISTENVKLADFSFSKSLFEFVAKHSVDPISNARFIKKFVDKIILSTIADVIYDMDVNEKHNIFVDIVDGRLALLENGKIIHHLDKETQDILLSEFEKSRMKDIWKKSREAIDFYVEKLAQIDIEEHRLQNLPNKDENTVDSLKKLDLAWQSILDEILKVPGYDNIIKEYNDLRELITVAKEKIEKALLDKQNKSKVTDDWRRKHKEAVVNETSLEDKGTVGRPIPSLQRPLKGGQETTVENERPTDKPFTPASIYYDR